MLIIIINDNVCNSKLLNKFIYTHLVNLLVVIPL